MPVAYDMALTADGDLPLQPGLVSGVELVAQRVAFALRLHRGEYLLDTRKGLPWLDWMQTRPAPLDTMDAAIKATILGVPGVLSIVEYTRTQGDTDDAWSITARILTSDEEEFTAAITRTAGGVPYVLASGGVRSIA